MDAKKVQQFGLDLHQGLNDQDQLLMEQCERLQDALAMRIQSPMKMRDGQRTINALGDQIALSIDARNKLVAAHCSAEKDAEQMGWPTNCPVTDVEVPSEKIA